MKEPPCTYEGAALHLKERVEDARQRRQRGQRRWAVRRGRQGRPPSWRTEVDDRGRSR
uniref:Uncharacterized protein n=1 Tax=Arundo donax TaxID=35708 RepID=A0A0A8XX20_ARUDO